MYFSINFFFFALLNVFFNLSVIAGKESETTERLNNNKIVLQASLVAQLAKNPPAMKAIQGQSLGREDFLEEEMPTHSNIHAGKHFMGRGAWQALVYRVTKLVMT